MQPETRFKNKVMPRLQALPKSHWFKIQQVALRGVPDILGCINGRFVALELKVGKNKASALQAFYLEKLSEAGAYTAIVTPDNFESVYQDLIHMEAAV